MNATLAASTESIPPRPAVGSELDRAERCAVAFAIDAGNAELPPNISRLIECAPESFSDPRHAKIAVCIRAMRADNTAVHLESVGAKSGETLYVLGELASSLPRDLAELEAESALAAFELRKARSILDDASTAINSAPSQAKTICAGAIRTLTELAGANSEPERCLTIRSPGEILAMSFDDSDRILGDRLLCRGSSLVIAGPGSIGKSRLVLQLAVACRAGLPFLGFETHGRTELRWLILQAENSNRRLQADWLKLRAWVGDKHWPRIEAGLHIHCLEADQDGFLSLDSPKAESRLRDAITRFRPDVIVWDSLYNFAAGDLNSDEAMAGSLLSISRLSKTGDALRAIIVLHHALTGKAGAAKSTGWDRTSYGRNSKVLHQWTRAQINLAPGNADSSDVVVCSCGKLNDGQPFAPFAFRLDPDSMIYAPDADFDLSAWQSEVTGKRAEPLMSIARVAELCDGTPTKSELAKRISEDCGCGRTASFNWVKRAEQSRRIHWTKATETYVRKP